MKETFYFSHDYNARSDAKIKRMIYSLGIEGYGIYWALIEDLYNNENSITCDYDFIEIKEEPEPVELISRSYNIIEELVINKKIILI